MNDETKSEYGWVGIETRHKDGRAGKVVYEGANFGGIAIQIKANDGSEAWIDLSTMFGDTGEPGWSWLCKNFSGHESRWLELGNWKAMTDRNERNKASDQI